MSAIYVIFLPLVSVAGRQGTCSSLSPGGGTARCCDALFCRKSSGIWYDPASFRPGSLASCGLCCFASPFLLEIDGSARWNALLLAGDKLCMVRRPSSHRRLWPLVVWRRSRGIGPKSGQAIPEDPPCPQMRWEVEWGDVYSSCVAVALWLSGELALICPASLSCLPHPVCMARPAATAYRTVALTLVLGSDSRGVYFLRALDRGGFIYDRSCAASAQV